MITINQKLLPINTKKRSGIKIPKVGFFIDHDTGNANSTAQNNVDYFYRTANESDASAHMFIDDIQALECIPCTSIGNTEKAWHVLYEKTLDNTLYGDDANDIAIGLELCYFPTDKTRSLKAYNNYIEVAAYLCKIHNVLPTKRSGHMEIDPQRKTDPNNALQYIGKTYANMKTDIVSKYNELYGANISSEVSTTVKLGYEKIRFGGHTDVHIYRTKTIPELVLGVRDKRETLPVIMGQYPTAICGINCGMFSYDGSENDAYGLIISQLTDRSLTVSKYFQNSSPNYTDFIANRDGSIVIETVKDYSVNTARLSNIQKTAYFGTGTSYALKIKGVDSQMNWTKFPHHTSYTNRTIIGKDVKNGIWYLIVADCGTYDKGLRAVDEVALCNQLLISDACNLDGGGSSSMWLNGKGIVTGNYTATRQIGSAIIIRS